MWEIHNLQLILTQMPRVVKINEAQAVANGAQIISVVNEEKKELKTTKVIKLSEIERTEKEDPQKRKLKKSKIDLYK